MPLKLKLKIFMKNLLVFDKKQRENNAIDLVYSFELGQ